MEKTLSPQDLLMAGRFAEALAGFDLLLLSRPGDMKALFGRATALKLMSRMAEARAGYDAVLAKVPSALGALNNRGEVLNVLGLPQAALRDFDSALLVKPDFPQSLVGRGVALQMLHRTPEALTCLERATRLWPQSPDAHFHHGAVLAELTCLEDAVASYDKAIALQPDFFGAINNRSVALIGLKRFAEAAEGYRKLQAFYPGNVTALHGLAAGAMHACDWTRREEFSEKIAAAVLAGRKEILPGLLLGTCDDPALLLACARNGFQNKRPADPLWRHRPFSAGKIRLAYCSADFHSHAMPRLMAGVLESHDRARFEVIGISFGPDDGSDMRKRVAKSFDRFYDVPINSNEDIAALIARLEVDIAIDLMGLTTNARTGIFAASPAPVQVSYLGFPGTMGAEFMDYIIGDAIVTPPETQAFFTEKILALADTYWPTDDKRADAGTAPGRHEAGLPAKGFVFCCFNNNWKIAPAQFDIWMRLLKAVPDSVLWLLEDSKEAAANLRKEAVGRGVDAARLVFAPRVSPEAHLARHRLADLFLDTLPYNAHTTASDALWVGVPLVTCMGQVFQSRVAASILNAMGLCELIARDPRDYEQLALALANDPPRLAALKARLAANRATTALFDTARFTRALEAGYEKMRDDYLSRTQG